MSRNLLDIIALKLACFSRSRLQSLSIAMLHHVVYSHLNSTTILDHNQVILEGVPNTVRLDKIAEAYPEALNIIDFRGDPASEGYV